VLSLDLRRTTLARDGSRSPLKAAGFRYSRITGKIGCGGHVLTHFHRSSHCSTTDPTSRVGSRAPASAPNHRGKGYFAPILVIRRADGRSQSCRSFRRRRWIGRADCGPAAIGHAFPSRIAHSEHLSTRQYAILVDEWVLAVGLRKEEYGTHSLRWTKASIIYKATGNLRAVQILLDHTKDENTVRYLGVDVEDALTLAEGTEI
jgi:hypothetical protein